MVTLFDERAKADVEKSLGGAIPPRIVFFHGRMSEKAATGAELVVLSPGVPQEKLPREALRRARVPVWGELELGFRRFRGSVAGVTGTNGKSTVTTLLGEMASRAFPRVFVGGNLACRLPPRPRSRTTGAWWRRRFSAGDDRDVPAEGGGPAEHNGNTATATGLDAYAGRMAVSGTRARSTRPSSTPTTRKSPRAQAHRAGRSPSPRRGLSREGEP